MWISICHQASNNVKTAVAASILITILASFSNVNFNAFNVLAQIQKEPLQVAKYPSSILIEKGIDLIYNQGNYSEAIKYFDSVLSRDPTNIDAIFYKGAALGSLGKTSEAIPFINKAIRLSDKALIIDPTNVDILSIVGRAYNRLQNYSEAIKYFDKALAIDPNYEYALANKGLALNKLGSFGEAIKYFDKALSIDPKFVYASSGKGDALSNQGNYSEAIKYYNKALNISPNYVSILLNEGNIYYKARSYDEAKKYFDRVLVVAPNNTYALNGIGLVLYYEGAQYEAIKYFDKALAIDPSGTDIIEELKMQREHFNSTSFNQSKNQQGQQFTGNAFPTVSSNNQSNAQHIIGSHNVTSDYTFMIYMVGSDLEAKSYAATQNIQQMEKVGSNSKVNVIVETGGGSPQTTIDSKRLIDFTKVQRYKILRNGIQPLGDLGTKNTGDPNTLSDFIIWGISHFPAKKYAVILWDHGGGINGFGGDQQFNDDKLTVDEIHRAFADAAKVMVNKKLELIGFDSCLMASIEVANSVKQFGNYMVASEEIEPQWGWDYSSILTSLTAHSNEDGSMLGRTIVDSFFKRTQLQSESQGYSAQREITLSVVNLTMIPRIVYNLDNLVDYLGNKITDAASENSLTQSVDSSERYGQTFKGDSGLVDIYDLASNIKERFPQSEHLVDAVQKSLNNTVVYRDKGDSSPNANGLSIYMPVREDEFTDARGYTLPSWQKVVDVLYNTIKNDHQIPIIQSNVTGDRIKGHIYGNDVATVTLWIYTSSMPEGNTAIYQDLDPSSFIKSDGSFEYKWNRQILSLCNEQNVQQHQDQVCHPALMKLETNKNKKFALIPVKLISKIDDFDEEVSLKYELDDKNNFTFLGARPEIEQSCQEFSQELCQLWSQQTVSKENWPLRYGDKVSPLIYTFQSEDDAISSLSFVEYPPMQLKATDNFKPKYVNYNGTYDIQFRVCDYSNNCWNTRYFHFNKTAMTQPQAIDLAGKNIPICKESSNIDNFSEYINPLYKFKIKYPSNWQKIEQGLPDTNIVHFNAPGFNDNGYPPAQIYLSVSYWPGTYNEFINDSIPSTLYSPFLRIIDTNHTYLGGYPAYKVLTSERGKQTLDINALIGHTWYSITFDSDSSKFFKYLPYAEKVIDSFQVCTGEETLNPAQHGNVNAFTNNTYSSNSFSAYASPLFKIQYPSNWKVVEDDVQRQVRFYSPTGLIPNTSAYDREKTMVLFMITDLGKASMLNQRGVSLEEFAKIISNNTKGDGLPGFNIYESKPIVFNGNPAYKITISYFNTKYKSAWKDTTIITILDNKVYFLEYSGELTRYEHYLPTIENMLNSFRGNILTTSHN